MFSKSGAVLCEVKFAGDYLFAIDHVLTLDEASLAIRARDAAEQLDKANADMRLMNEAASVVVRSFCRANCAAPVHN